MQIEPLEFKLFTNINMHQVRVNGQIWLAGKNWNFPKMYRLKFNSASLQFARIFTHLATHSDVLEALHMIWKSWTVCLVLQPPFLFIFMWGWIIKEFEEPIEIKCFCCIILQLVFMYRSRTISFCTSI